VCSIKIVPPTLNQEPDVIVVAVVVGVVVAVVLLSRHI